MTQDFYNDYSYCDEIEKKQSRPYVQICIEINGITFAIPLRSNVSHQYVLFSDKENKCGVDFSKSVVITKDIYLDKLNKPYIRSIEFNALKGKEYIIKQKFITYIRKYKKAKLHMDKQHNENLCKYSTLQYFEEFIKDI